MLDGDGTSRVALGVILGLVVGKTVGISAAAWLAVKLRLGVLPTGATWRQLVGVASLGGIGFTVAMFVTGLAFDHPGLTDASKLGILVASALAAVVGTLLIVTGPKPAPIELDEPIDLPDLEGAAL